MFSVVPNEVVAIVASRPDWAELRWEISPRERKSPVRDAPIVLSAGRVDVSHVTWVVSLKGEFEKGLGSSDEVTHAMVKAASSAAVSVRVAANKKEVEATRRRNADWRRSDEKEAAVMRQREKSLVELVAALWAAPYDSERFHADLVARVAEAVVTQQGGVKHGGMALCSALRDLALGYHAKAVGTLEGEWPKIVAEARAALVARPKQTGTVDL